MARTFSFGKHKRCFVDCFVYTKYPIDACAAFIGDAGSRTADSRALPVVRVASAARRRPDTYRSAASADQTESSGS